MERYDVIVCGGGISGVAAAMAEEGYVKALNVPTLQQKLRSLGVEV